MSSENLKTLASKKWLYTPVNDYNGLIDKDYSPDSSHLRKIHGTHQFSEASGPQGHVFEKTNKKTVFRYDLEECAYQISSLNRFSFGQEVPYLDKVTNQPTYIRVKQVISFTGCSPQWNFANLMTINNAILHANLSCF